MRYPVNISDYEYWDSEVGQYVGFLVSSKFDAQISGYYESSSVLVVFCTDQSMVNKWINTYKKAKFFGDIHTIFSPDSFQKRETEYNSVNVFQKKKFTVEAQLNHWTMLELTYKITQKIQWVPKLE